MREPRFCFKTLSDVDVLDDGYKWRKRKEVVVEEEDTCQRKILIVRNQVEEVAWEVSGL